MIARTNADNAYECMHGYQRTFSPLIADILDGDCSRFHDERKRKMILAPGKYSDVLYAANDFSMVLIFSVLSIALIVIIIDSILRWHDVRDDVDEQQSDDGDDATSDGLDAFDRHGSIR